MGRILKQLFWTLTETLYLCCQGVDLHLVRQLIEIHVFLQGVWLEKVIRKLRTISSLEVPKYQINPFVKIGADMVTFKSISILHDKILMT